MALGTRRQPRADRVARSKMTTARARAPASCVGSSSITIVQLMPDCDCEGASVGGIACAVRCAASCPESGPGATRRALPNQIAPGAREICAPPSRVPGAAFRPSAPPPGGSLPASKRPAREKRGRTRARRRRARPILRRSAASRAKAPSVVRVTTPAVASWRPFGAAARVGKARVPVKRLKRRRGARQKNVQARK